MIRKNAAVLMSAVIIVSLFAGCGSADKNVSQNNNDYTNETQITTKAVSDGETKTVDDILTKADRETEYITQEVSSEDQTDSVNDNNSEVPESGGDSGQADGYNDSQESSLLASAMVNTVTYSAYANEVLRLVSIERASVGAAPLVLDEALCNAANMRAIEMDYSGYFSHTRPNGDDCFEVYDICNVEWQSGCAENIAAGYPDPVAVVDGWMHSEGHKANILNPSYTKMGLGYSTGGGGVYNHYWAQEFAG